MRFLYAELAVLVVVSFTAGCLVAALAVRLIVRRTVPTTQPTTQPTARARSSSNGRAGVGFEEVA